MSIDDEITRVARPKRRRWRWLAVWVIVLAIVLGLGRWLYLAVEAARRTARAGGCCCHLNQIQFALASYHEIYHCFPPAYIGDAEGKPAHSWRVLLLPFLGSEELYQQYNFSEPWDGPNNRKLGPALEKYLSCPNDENRAPGMTNFVVITGPGTAFPGATSTKYGDFHDGLPTSILVAEIAHSNIHWMEPRDLNLEEMTFRVNDDSSRGLASNDPGGPGVVFGDSISVYRIHPSLPPETLRALITIAGGEPVDKKRLCRDGLFLRWDGSPYPEE